MRRNIIIFLITAALLCASYGVYLYRLDDSILYFEQALEKINANETVSVKGQQYEVRGGEIIDGEKISEQNRELILRLAYAKLSASRNPVFALPGTDLEQFELGTEELGLTARSLSEIQDSQIKKFLVQHALYPTSYLQALKQAEVERRRFISTGSHEDLKRYHQALTEVPRRYYLDAWQFVLAYKFIVPEDGTTYVTEKHLINRDNSLKTFVNLRSVMKKANAEIALNTHCFQGNISYCNPKAIPTDLKKTDSKVSHNVDNKLLEEVKTYYDSRYSFRPEQKVKPPYVLLDKSVCLDKETTPLFSFNKNRSDKSIIPVGDVRFVRSKDYEAIAFFNELQELGINYVPTGPFSHYTCQTLSSEAGLISAVYDVRSFVGKNPISSMIDGTYSKLPELLTLEHNLTGPVVHESEARDYLKLALELIDDGLLPNDIQEKVFELVLMLDSQNTAADIFLHDVYATENDNLNALKNHISVNLTAKHLFFSRSAFVSLSLLPLAPFVRVEDLFQPINLARSDTPYVYLSELLVAGFNLDELISTSRVYSDLHSE